MWPNPAGTNATRRPVIGLAPLLHRVVLDDHARLPWRFFGRLTASILADLRG
jgi:hypothetical protein